MNIYYDCINDLIEFNMGRQEIINIVEKKVKAYAYDYFDQHTLNKVLQDIIDNEYHYSNLFDNKNYILKYSIINNKIDIIDILILTQEELEKYLTLL